MSYRYFPGCTLSTQAIGYDVSGRAVAEALEMALEELPEWQCCGATFPLATDDSMALIAPTRMLLQAEKSGGHTTTLCAICYHVLKRTQIFLTRYPDTLERINWFIEESYQGQARISHFLELLRDDLGWEILSERVTHPLHQLKVAPYYGCLLLRPHKEIGLDDPDNPTILHDCLAAIGCKVIDFPYQTECCGSYLTVTKPGLPEKLSMDILISARRNGAQAIVTACPLCQFNLEAVQGAAREGQISADNELPVFYFTQLMAVALGLDQSAWGVDQHYADVLVQMTSAEPATTVVGK